MRNSCAPPRGAFANPGHAALPPFFLEYSIVAPSVDSRTFSIKGQSSLDEQSKFYRINPLFRPSTRHAVRFVLPSTLSSLVLIRTTIGITSATTSAIVHPECTTRCGYVREMQLHYPAFRIIQNVLASN